MADDSDGAIGCAVLLLVFFGLLADVLILHISPALSGEVVIYNAFCPAARLNGQCKANEEWSGRWTYEANSDRQFVLNWGEDGEPSRYENCAVRDSRNWSCDLGKNFSGDSDKITMIQGEVNKDFAIQPFYRVSPEWWYFLRLRNYFNGRQR